MLKVLKPELEERKAIRDILTDMAEYYSVKLSDKQIEMFVSDLIEMGSDNVKKAAYKYRTTWSSLTFPLPSQLRKAIAFYYIEPERKHG